MERQEIEKLLEAFALSPENGVLAELIIKELVQGEAWEDVCVLSGRADFQQLLENSPFLAQSRGIACMHQGDYEAACDCLQKALLMEGVASAEKCGLMDLLVRCLVKKSSLQRATTWLQELIEEFPDYDVTELQQAVEELRRQSDEGAADGVEQRREIGELTTFQSLEKEKMSLTFADVGGMQELKKMAEMKIVKPFKNPELFKKYGKKAGGGILLYGPPGCGKTYFARAIAGECDASFFSVGIHDILDMYLGNSERNVHNLFVEARKQAPAILFFDEIDALGRKRELARHSAITGTINSFLNEMDGLDDVNENLLVIGATNVPWDVDSAFKRPGRFDTLFLVPPPDEASRREILQAMMRNRPAGEIDYGLLAEKTSMFSGADLSALVEKSVERVIDEIMESGEERDIEMTDFLSVLGELKGTIGEWFSMAENYVEYANNEGHYDDIQKLLNGTKKSKNSRWGFF